jgi:hypothetical protein
MKFLFYHKSIHRDNHRHFLTIGFKALTREDLGVSLWGQGIYQTFEDYRKERGKPRAPVL